MAEETNHVSLSFWDAGLVEACRQAPRLLLTTKKQAARRPRVCTHYAHQKAHREVRFRAKRTSNAHAEPFLLTDDVEKVAAKGLWN